MADPAIRQRTTHEFERRGIASERLELISYDLDLASHFRTYSRVDIALDPFPYNGTTTTCEALWMGVPVVTLAGGTHVARVGVSLLTNIGLPELIASNPEEYVSIAAALAADLDRLRELRGTLRQRMLSSPLMNGPQFARDVEAAYRDIWRRWCAAPNRIIIACRSTSSLEHRSCISPAASRWLSRRIGRRWQSNPIQHRAISIWDSCSHHLTARRKPSRLFKNHYRWLPIKSNVSTA